MAKSIFFFIFLASSLSSMGQKMTPEDYVSKYKDLAITEMERSGVPAAITLAQGILETQAGNSDLFKQSNNHFGIKCKSDWTGPSVTHDDDAANECFRAYSSSADSYKDHSDFLRNSGRYSFLFKLDPTDYKGWAYGLKKAGYATSSTYANTLIKYVEKYNLEQYTMQGLRRVSNNGDAEVATQDQTGNPSTNSNETSDWKIILVNQSSAVHVPAGTSLLAIATRYNIRLSKLLEFNELANDGILNRAQIIFLEKKSSQSTTPYITTSSPESIHDIAQANGILTASLLSYNSFAADEIVAANSTVYLQPHPEEGNSETAGTDAMTHTVEPKEGLYAIARKYGVSVPQLKAWNQLQSDNLQIGQKLVIYK